MQMTNNNQVRIMSSSFSRAMLGRLVALAALMCAYLGAVPAAQAVPDASLVDANQRGSLTVVKSAGDPFAHFGDPTRRGEPQPVQPIKDLEFQAQKVSGIDLTTNAGWEAASRLNLTDFMAGGPRTGDLGPALTTTTDEEGKARFKDLDLGLYLVTEASGPAQALGFNVINPFFVTVPTTAADGKSWNYDVSVQAKDQRIAARKAAAKRCIEVGESVQLGITSTLPAPDEKDRIGSFQIVDPLAVEIEHVAGTDQVFLTKADTTTVPDRLDAEDFEVSVEDNIAKLVLRDSGLKKLAKWRKGNPGVALTWRFDVKAVATPEAGYVKNKAYVLPPGYPDFDKETTPGVPTNEVRISIGNCTPETPTKPRDVPEIPPSTPPSKPGTPTVPVPVPGPGIPGHPETFEPIPQAPSSPKKTPSKRTGLADTGANVIYMVGTGVVLLLAGLWLARRSRQESEN